MRKANTVETPANMRGNKEAYIELLRAVATIAVFFLHINMTLVANYSIDEIGVWSYAIFNDCYIMVKWAVPCFIMISGALLLNPSRNVTYEKIKKYIIRMALVLLTFGVFYAFTELFFETRRISITIVLKSVLNMLQGQSWSHMWYVYMLIGLYLITMPLRYVMDKVTEKELEGMVIGLALGLFIVPSINTVFSLKLENYMLISEYIGWYVIGYYLSVTKKNWVKLAIPIAIVSVILMIGLENISLFQRNESFLLNHQTKNVLTLGLGMSVFVLVKSIVRVVDYKEGAFCRIICENSFAIYLIHPFWINLIYKVFKITPLSFPIYIGIPVLFLVVFIMSLISGAVVRNIPLIRKIL